MCMSFLVPGHSILYKVTRSIPPPLHAIKIRTQGEGLKLKLLVLYNNAHNMYTTCIHTYTTCIHTYTTCLHTYTTCIQHVCMHLNVFQDLVCGDVEVDHARSSVAETACPHVNVMHTRQAIHLQKKINVAF